MPLQDKKQPPSHNYYQATYEINGPYDKCLTSGDSMARQAYLYSCRQTVQSWLGTFGSRGRAACFVLELGCGMGELRDVSFGYVGVELSFAALRRGVDLEAEMTKPLRLINADMQTLPLKAASVDLIFSFQAIEHVPKPELVLAEIERVLTPGGVAILSPAWNCRPWRVKRLDVRPYKALSWSGRFEKATIPVRDHLLWRGAQALPTRLEREIRALRGSIVFDYRRLFPDFSLKTPHLADDDASVSMDAHAAILWYKSRGWDVLSHMTFRSRLLVRHVPVVVRKPLTEGWGVDEGAR